MLHLQIVRRCVTVASAFALGLALFIPGPSSGRTLAEIQSRRVISVCANPDALPYASDRSEQPGFQIELARAIAQKLGVALQVEWILPTFRANLVNCDLIMDAFNDPAVHEGRLKLSKPYQRSGVALGVRANGEQVKGFEELKPGQRIGVMVGSLASVILGKRGLTTVPYSFEQDMVEDVAAGELYACASSPATIAYYSHTHASAPLNLVHAYDLEPELSWTVSVGMRKADDALVSVVNQALDELLNDGIVTAIYANYGVEHRKP